jgi:hypothetical protein
MHHVVFQAGMRYLASWQFAVTAALVNWYEYFPKFCYPDLHLDDLPSRVPIFSRIIVTMEDAYKLEVAGPIEEGVAVPCADVNVLHGDCDAVRVRYGHTSSRILLSTVWTSRSGGPLSFSSQQLQENVTALELVVMGFSMGGRSLPVSPHSLVWAA